MEDDDKLVFFLFLLILSQMAYFSCKTKFYIVCLESWLLMQP